MTNPKHEQPENAAVNEAAPVTGTPWQRGLTVFKKLGPAGVLAVMASVLPALGGFVLLAKIDAVGQWLQSHGSQGKLMYAGGFAVLAGFALLPTYASASLGGWAFGFGTGLALAMVGFLGGSMIGYASGRLASGDRVERLLAENARWKAVRDGLVGGGFWKSLGIVTLVRMPPNSPFALTNLVLSSVRVPIVVYGIGTLLGMLPRTALVVYLASKIQGEFNEEAATSKPWWMIPVGLVMLFGVLYVLKAVADRALGKLVGAAEGVPNGPVKK